MESATDGRNRSWSSGWRPPTGPWREALRFHTRFRSGGTSRSYETGQVVIGHIRRSCTSPQSETYKLHGGTGSVARPSRSPVRGGAWEVSTILRVVGLMAEFVRGDGACRPLAQSPRTAAACRRWGLGRRVDGLEKRLATSDEEARAGLEVMAGEVKALRQELDTWRMHVERRLLRLEDGSGLSVSPRASLTPRPTKRSYLPLRTYPQLVTLEAEDGERGCTATQCRRLLRGGRSGR